MDSKSRVKKDKIKPHLKRFRELDSEYFLFLDKDSKNTVDELIKEGLISQENVFFFENELEEEYPLEKLISEIESFKPELKDIFEVSDVKKELKSKPLKKVLSDIAYRENKSFNLDDVKIKLAKSFSDNISKELENSIIDKNGTHRGDWKPKSKNYSQIVERIRPLADKIKKISTDYFVVKNKD